MENEKHDILKNLISEREIEKAPQGFTSRVMKKIEAESSKETAFDLGGFLSPQYWLLIGSAMGIAVIFLFSYDFEFLSWIFKNADLKNITGLFSQFVLQARDFVVQINISSTSIAILAGLLLLFGLDRLLKKRFAFQIFSF
ncbi:MAG: hypothetical protein U5Q03_14575 [Bacteroidota bacterium]|nr:hypothetical protein [Bacteroidota bacterium]